MELQNYYKKKRTALRDGNHRQAAEMCNKIATHYHNDDKFEDAFQEFEEERDLWRRVGSRMDEGRAERMMGEMKMILGEFEAALAMVNRFLVIAKEENDQVEKQRAYTTVGRIYLTMGQSEDVGKRKSFDNAEKMFLKSLVACKTLQGSHSKVECADMMSRVYLNLGIVQEERGDFDGAENYYEKAVQMTKNNDLHSPLHHCYMSLGRLHSLYTKDYAKSLLMHNLALKTAERLSDRSVVAETLLSKANVLLESGDSQSAKQPLVQAYKLKCQKVQESVEHLLKCVVILEQTQEKLLRIDSEHFKEMKDLNEKMGDAWCNLKNYTKASEHYEKMLEYARKNGETGRQLIPAYVSLYSTYKDDMRFNQALEFLWLEYELVKDDDDEACATLLTIADVQERAKFSSFDVNRTYQQAFDAQPNKKVVKRWIAQCQKNGMIIEEEHVRRLAGTHRIVINEDSQESEDAENEDSVTSINEDIDLEALFPPQEEQRSRKRTGLVVRKNAKGETQLHQACIAGNLTLVRKLLDQGHAVNVRDNVGWTPLHEVANLGHTEIVIALLNHGLTVTEINDRGDQGVTPLHDACRNAHFEIVELLLDRGANPTLLTDRGESIMDCLMEGYNEDWGRKLNEAEMIIFETWKTKIQNLLQKAGTVTKKKSFSSKASTSSGSSAGSHKKDSSYLSHSRIRQGLDSDPEDTPTPTKSTPKSKNNKNATSEYRDVMKMLRNPRKPSPPPTQPAQKRPALVHESEIVEDWLDDDLAPNKRRKVNLKSPARPTSTQHPAARKHLSPLQLSPIRKTSSPAKPIRNLEDEFIIPAPPQIMADSTSPDVFDDFMIDDEIPLWRENSFHQPPLNPFEPDSTSTEQSRRSLISSIAVRIEEELISVPVKNDEIDRLTIGWLAKEAAGRYASLFGRTPDMQLTLDGAVTMNNDPLAVALNSTEIKARILNWKNVSIHERYVSACKDFKQGPIEVVSCLLEEGQANRNFQLADQCLTPSHLEPICSALKLERPVTLNLANNFLTDEGVQNLLNIDAALKDLQHLDVSGNFLSFVSLTFLRRLDHLETLILNFNSIGDLGLLNLNFGTCTRLGLRACGLQNVTDLPLEGVQELDLSFNNVNSSIMKVRRKIVEVRILNLSFIKDVVWNDFFTGSLPTLTELSLAGNGLGDAEVYQVLQVCSNLRLLDVSYNTAMTGVTMEKLLTSSIRRLHVQGCRQLLDHVDDWNETRWNAPSSPAPEFLQITVNEAKQELQLSWLKTMWLQWHRDRGEIQVNQLQVTAFLLLDDNGQSLSCNKM